MRVRRVGGDYREIDVEMPLRLFNRNYVGTHFGGSLYAMTDPFCMLMLIHNPGPGYVVWDKAAEIEFLKPGRGRVSARFRLDESTLARTREQTRSGRRALPTFRVDVTEAAGAGVARVKKVLYVREKEAPETRGASAAPRTA